MISMTLSRAAAAMQAELIGADREFTGVSTDTRNIAADNLFIALVGERFDAHDFLTQVVEQRAAGAVVQRKVDVELPLLKVDDTRMALGRLAACWRQQFDIPLIAVTGSNGKTTVKEMLSAILGQQASVLATRGNLNNDIGVPLTLFGLGSKHQAAVIEMGANHAGEIEYLMSLATPTVSILNNAGAAHLEGFGSLEGVAQAKGEIIRNLQPDATAIINADDRFAADWRAMVPSECKALTFSIEADADVSATYQSVDGGSQLHLQTLKGAADCTLPLPGKHNVMNALAATAAALAAGVSLAQVVTGLESMSAVPGRLQRSQRADGLVVINDSYNANPTSTRAAIDVLARERAPRCLVLGNMGELGGDAEALHAEMGRYARQQGIEQCFALGELAAHTAEAFGPTAQAFGDKAELIAQLRKAVQSGGSVLIKGSRVMRMEEVAQALLTSEVTH